MQGDGPEGNRLIMEENNDMIRNQSGGYASDSASAYSLQQDTGYAQNNAYQDGSNVQNGAYQDSGNVQNGAYQDSSNVQNSAYQDGGYYRNNIYPDGSSPQGGTYSAGGCQNNYYANNGYNNGSYTNYNNGCQPYNNGQPYADGQLELEEPVKVSEWLVSMLLMMIPCVNIILVFVWAFSSSEKKSKSNYFKASLILFAISMGLSFLFWMGIVVFAVLAS